MPGEAAKRQKQTGWTDQQQDERRREERRQTQDEPQEERRREERRQGPGSGETTMKTQEQTEHGRQPSAKKWQGENAQSGTSQAQKGDGRTPAQQTVPAERHEQKHGDGTQGRRERASRDFGESHDPAFGEGRRGAGGKIDSTQRDMGQTGQTMKSGAQHQVSQQQGPYGPRGKHRGPVASGKPLLDDWGKSDKH